MVESKAVHIAGDGLERERGEVEIATAPPWGSRYRRLPRQSVERRKTTQITRNREGERERVTDRGLSSPPACELHE